MLSADELRGHVHEVAAIYECYALVRDELLGADCEHGHEEYKRGLYRAMDLILRLHERSQDQVNRDLHEWEIAARRELRIHAPRDPRSLPAVVIQ